MTTPLKTFTATLGLTCGLIACASPEGAAPAQTTTPGAATTPTTAQPSAAAAPVATAATATQSAGAVPTQNSGPTAAAAGSSAVLPATPATAAGAPTAPAAPAAANTAAPQQPNAAQPTGPTMAPAELDHTQDIRGNCNLHTNFADDHACIPAPKPGEGIQIHIGPSNYDDPAEVAKYVMHPGQESSECFTLRTPNTEKIIYQTYMLSGRAGTHHMINTIYQGELPTGSFGACGGFSEEMDPNAMAPMPVGSLPGASKAYMPRGKVAPEYAHVGRVLEANALVQGDMHYFNFTDKDILREVWLNLYFAPKEQQITTYSDQIRGFGGLGWSFEPIEPGTDMVYKYECPIAGNGKIMSLLGHYHAHGKRFTASLKRKSSGMIEKVFEMFDYLDPATFEYNSITTNPMFAPNTAGAYSGILDVKDGDILQWECHIINDSDVALPFTNEVKTGEMCNVWGYSIDTTMPITCDLY